MRTGLLAGALLYSSVSFAFAGDPPQLKEGDHGIFNGLMCEGDHAKDALVAIGELYKANGFEASLSTANRYVAQKVCRDAPQTYAVSVLEVGPTFTNGNTVFEIYRLSAQANGETITFWGP